MKTNKSYSKRIRVTKNGKLVARRPGQNHFNARASSSKQMARNRTVPFTISNKSRSRFITDNS